MFLNRRGNDSKRQKTPVLAPVNISISIYTTDEQFVLFQKFADAATIDEQILILKKIIDKYGDMFDTEVIKFMTAVFLEADAEHPVKCFISRYVTKNENLQKSIPSILASDISARISAEPTDYKEYANVVTKVATCIDFDPGVEALRTVQYELATYLKTCLTFCLDIYISYSPNDTLTIMDMKEMLKVYHHAVRLLLHIVQTANDETLDKLKPMFMTIRRYMETLILDEDVAVCTKSMCGILFVSMYIAEYGPDSWEHILDPYQFSDTLCNLTMVESTQLSLYSALITVVPLDKLESVIVNGVPVIVFVLSTLVDINKRTAIKSVRHAIAHTVCQICRSLEKITVLAAGRHIVKLLDRYGRYNMNHYLDDVVQLTWKSLKLMQKYRSYTLEKKYFPMPVNNTFHAGKLIVSFIE